MRHVRRGPGLVTKWTLYCDPEKSRMICEYLEALGRFWNLVF